MPPPSISDSKLDDVLDFNQYLLKLAKAGVPIGLDFSKGTEDLPRRLDENASKIAMGMARGSTVRQILESDQDLPSQYRTSLLTWLYCDRSPSALTALSECAEVPRQIERVVSFAFLQPLILLGLVYLGFVFLLLGVAPKLEAINLQIGSKPGLGLQWLTMARESLWIWSIGVPVFTVLALVIWNQERSRCTFGWFPGRARVSESIQKANYAEGFAKLLEHDHSLMQAQTMMGSFKSEAVPRRVPMRDTGTSPVALSPLLEWALGTEVGDVDRVHALHFSARAYRELAQSRTSQWRAWLPILAGAIFGGVLVLIFGLSLFTPMIELLTSLTKP